MDEVAKLGGAEVTRFEGTYDEAKVFFDELIVESDYDPELLAISALLFDEVEWDTTGDHSQTSMVFFLGPMRPSGIPTTDRSTSCSSCENPRPPAGR